MKLAYADPPYPGRAHLYADHTDYDGEVDHLDLLARLGEFDGWALSTNSDSLGYVLSLLRPIDVQVAAWVRTNAPPFNPDGKGAVRSWEPVVYWPARARRNDPGRVRDVFHSAAPTGYFERGLTGAKSREFACWVFGLLCAEPDDTLEDCFPGTGIVGEAWESWRSSPALFGGALGGNGRGTIRAPQTTEPLT